MMYDTAKNIILSKKPANATHSRVMSISINPSLDIIVIIGIIILGLLNIIILAG